MSKAVDSQSIFEATGKYDALASALRKIELSLAKSD